MGKSGEERNGGISSTFRVLIAMPPAYEYRRHGLAHEQPINLLIDQHREKRWIDLTRT
jgi:hypothetical protein